MDRLPRTIVALGLGLLLPAAGCRSTRPEVPPGRPFANDGRQRKAIEFSSDGHPVSAAATSNFMPNNVGGSNLAQGIDAGISRPDASAFGAPPGAFGPPGSAGIGQPPALNSPTSQPPASAPPVGSPPSPDFSIAPTRNTGPAPSQAVQPPIEAPGAMGSPDQLPSPN